MGGDSGDARLFEGQGLAWHFWTAFPQMWYFRTPVSDCANFDAKHAELNIRLISPPCGLLFDQDYVYGPQMLSNA
jgi:hypothetical protein